MMPQYCSHLSSFFYLLRVLNYCTVKQGNFFPSASRYLKEIIIVCRHFVDSYRCDYGLGTMLSTHLGWLRAKTMGLKQEEIFAMHAGTWELVGVIMFLPPHIPSATMVAYGPQIANQMTMFMTATLAILTSAFWSFWNVKEHHLSKNYAWEMICFCKHRKHLF